MEENRISGNRIHDMQADQRPRERLEIKGSGALTNAELLAILLRTGIKGISAVELGQRLLNEWGGLRGLQKADFIDLKNGKGIGKAKASQLKAAIELGSRLQGEQDSQRVSISSPEDAADLLRYDLSGLTRETFWVIMLDVRLRLIRKKQMYTGSVTMSTVRIAEIFKEAILSDAVSIITVHNHPSGDPAPSPDDIALTRAIVQAGKLLDVDVSDHIIIGSDSFVSLKQRRLGFD